jgi:membrane AbrB-like protein
MIFVGGIGGLIGSSLTGLSVGWMIGSMLILGIVSLWRPNRISWFIPPGGLHKGWKQAGQVILAIVIGQQMTMSVVHMFETSWTIISVILVLSLGFSILSGLFLWRLSNTSLLTSLYATTPGGVSCMPSLSQEVGANPIMVSVIQTMRIFLVVSIVPLFAARWQSPDASTFVHHANTFHQGTKVLNIVGSHLSGTGIWTLFLVIAATVGYYISKKLKIPAPRLVGGIIGVSVAQVVSSVITGVDIVPWLPGWMKILAQIFLGASIGLSITREMFVGMGQVIFLGFIGSVALVGVMMAISVAVSHWTGIPVVTSILAFAPGGVAEMAISAVSLRANAPFVVAAQTLRLVTILLILPPVFRLLRERIKVKESQRTGSFRGAL